MQQPRRDKQGERNSRTYPGYTLPDLEATIYSLHTVSVRGLAAHTESNLSLWVTTPLLQLGVTYIPKEVFDEYLLELTEHKYNAGTYNLLNNNCNNFSEEVSQFLTGNSIPAHITSLPAEVCLCTHPGCTSRCKQTAHALEHSHGSIALVLKGLLREIIGWALLLVPPSSNGLISGCAWLWMCVASHRLPKNVLGGVSRHLESGR
eukprot:4531378-Pyramimonas_sp.AAC.1